jgi:ankyrin repeat protein
MALPNGEIFGQKAVELLLAAPNLIIVAKDDQAQTAMHLACEYNFPNIVSLLLQNEDNIGPQIDSKDRSKGTPLHRCALRDSLECAEVLIHYGADAALQDSLGNIPCVAIQCRINALRF